MLPIWTDTTIEKEKNKSQNNFIPYFLVNRLKHIAEGVKAKAQLRGMANRRNDGRAMASEI